MWWEFKSSNQIKRKEMEEWFHEVLCDLHLRDGELYWSSERGKCMTFWSTVFLGQTLHNVTKIIGFYAK